MTAQHIYKVFRVQEWEAFLANDIFDGSADDLRDGFIHFSLIGQLRGTLEKHYEGAGRLVLAKIDTVPLGDALIYETSRGGAKFPHLYAPLSMRHVTAHWTLEPNAAGRYELPELETES